MNIVNFILNPKINSELTKVWDNGVHKVGFFLFILRLVIVVLKYFSISYRFNYANPDSEYRVDCYCLFQMVVLGILLYCAPAGVVASLLAGYFLVEMFLSTANTVFLGRETGIKLAERSIALHLPRVCKSRAWLRRRVSMAVWSGCRGWIIRWYTSLGLWAGPLI